jgi:raffinose/stachyose/melibiose transport system permease protein
MTATFTKQDGHRTEMRRQISGWLFVAPILVLNLIVIVIPSIVGLAMAFTDWSGIGSMEFIGLANFRELFQDRVFFKALTHNLTWTLFFLTVPVALGLLGAYLLSGIKRGQMFFRVVYFIPYVIAAVVNAQLWRFLLNPRIGIGVTLAECCGLDFLDIAIFGSRDLALYGVAFVDMWHFWGFLLVLYLAAMSGVDVELYEVARLDGAGRWDQFRFVTLPSIRPTLVFTILMITIWSGLVFDYVYIITGGGPANASEVMGTYLYTSAFDRFEAGYAAAVGVFMALWVAIATGGFVTLRKLGWEV